MNKFLSSLLISVSLFSFSFSFAASATPALRLSLTFDDMHQYVQQQTIKKTNLSACMNESIIAFRAINEFEWKYEYIDSFSIEELKKRLQSLRQEIQFLKDNNLQELVIDLEKKLDITLKILATKLKKKHKDKDLVKRSTFLKEKRSNLQNFPFVAMYKFYNQSLLELEEINIIIEANELIIKEIKEAV